MDATRARSNALVRKRLVVEVAEGGLDLLSELVERGHVDILASARLEELHGGDLVDDARRAAHRLLDAVHRHLLLGRRVLDGLEAERVEEDDVLHHADRLVERAHLVVGREAVLREVVVLDDLCNLEHELVRLGERVLADELHNLGQVVLVLQDLLHARAHRDELGVRLDVEGLERAVVLGVGDEPVERREVLALRQLLVKAPEDLHDAERGRAHRVGEVATRRRDGTDDRDRARARRRAHELALARALVEGGEARAEVGGVARVSGHLGEAAGDLTERLGPARRRVGHHGHVVAHVAQVLCERDARVDGRLARSDGHVGRVGDEGGALHDGLLLAVDDHLELREVLEHLRHLVAALAAADVDNRVRVRVLGQRLRDDRLAAAERAGHGARAAEHGGEERVDHALPREQRLGTRQLLGDGARRADGPALLHRVLGHLALELRLEDALQDGVLALGGEPRHLAARDLARHHHDLVQDDVVLRDVAINVARADDVANLHVDRRELPRALLVEGGDVDATRDEDRAERLGDLLERTLDAVEDAAKDARAELERERQARAEDRVADRQAGRLLVHLDGGHVALEANDLTDQALVADAHQLVHGRA
mmetsp:Transcript_12586/g.39639  ORF Transcript_12586/g.39639 Transcript_12586/m.39639 type:complete len:601 (+) Transcript_12586:190-1992(+)